MSNELGERQRLPYQAAQVAASGVEKKDEFDPTATLTFPYLRHEESMLSANMRVPSSWQAHIRVAVTDEIRIPQLYIQVSNRPEQGLLKYNTALLTGGDEIKLEYITYRQEEDLLNDSIFRYEEHMAIMLTPKFLAEYIDKPLRIQISRPDSNVAFVVEVPSHYVAGVLYRLDPEKYEVEAAPSVPAGASAEQTRTPDPAWLKHSIATAIGMGLVGILYSGPMAGVVLTAAGFGFGAWYFRNFYRK